ncbi:hypothetical protein N431DRAFT_519266 [Stipitochalara longipes BDJ]|nr:hypothetical protein N431DRAFT_519266 [Stipitochalara longipes BDJ]
MAATVLDKDYIYHPGTLFLKVLRPHTKKGKGCRVLDGRSILRGPVYNIELQDGKIYFNIKESTTTVRGRLNALNLISHDWLQAQPSRSRQRRQQRRDKEAVEEIMAQNGEVEDGDEEGINTLDGLDPTLLHQESPFHGLDFTCQRAILMCHSLPRQGFYDFTEDTAHDQRESLFQSSTTKEGLIVDKYLPRVPGNGLLIIRGATGIGKTTFSTKALHLQLMRKQRLLTMAATNQAVNNMAQRLFAHVGGEDYFLMFRFWTERLELHIVKSTDPTNLAKAAARLTKNHSSNTGYSIDNSLAISILKLAGLVDTTNKKILDMRD